MQSELHTFDDPQLSNLPKDDQDIQQDQPDDEFDQELIRQMEDRGDPPLFNFDDMQAMTPVSYNNASSS